MVESALADWHGRLSASAGAARPVRCRCEFRCHHKDRILGCQVRQSWRRCSHRSSRRSSGPRLAFSLHAAFGERIVVDALSIDAAAGTVTGNGTFGGPDGVVEAHLRANVPELAPFAGLVWGRIEGSASLTADMTGTEKHPAGAL